MKRRHPLRVAAALELGEVLRSRWLYFCGVLYAVLAAIFVLVGMRESTVMGFTGMGRVLFSFCHALVVLLPLLALTATGQVIGQARDDGTLELLMSQPLDRRGWFGAVALVRFTVLLAPLALLLAGMVLFARLALGEAIPWRFLGISLAVSAALLWAFVGLGLLISATVRSQARAMAWLLAAWAAAVALLDFGLIGLMLQWQLPAQGVFLLAAANPVQAARMALLSAAEPELSVLGPVGFYLANRIGAAGLFLLGVLWPLAFGSLAWTLGCRRFRAGDLV